MTSTTISSEKAHSLQEEFFGNDLREQAVLSELGSLLPGHNRFIDVGANVGQYSYFANKFLWNAEIICVETNSDLLNLQRYPFAELIPKFLIITRSKF